MNNKGIEFKYLDHRDKRTKKLCLKPDEFLRRLLDHVPVTGLHTIRYYGLYAPASKAKHSRCMDEVGSLVGVNPSSGAQIQSMLLYCKTCGMPAKLQYQLWSAMQKGNSINKEGRRHSASGSVQQDDTTDIARVLKKKNEGSQILKSSAPPYPIL